MSVKNILLKTFGLFFVFIDYAINRVYEMRKKLISEKNEMKSMEKYQLNQL